MVFKQCFNAVFMLLAAVNNSALTEKPARTVSLKSSSICSLAHYFASVFFVLVSFLRASTSAQSDHQRLPMDHLRSAFNRLVRVKTMKLVV